MPSRPSADPAAETRVRKLTRSGFSPRQAFALDAGSWTKKKLIAATLTNRQASTLLAGTRDVADLIRRGRFTRAQAQLIFAFYTH